MKAIVGNCARRSVGLAVHIESFEGAGIDEEIEQKNRELNVVQSEYKKN